MLSLLFSLCPVGSLRRGLALVVFVAALLVPLTGRAASVTATFNAPTDVPITASSYFVSSNTVINFVLSFAPPTGTSLMVLNNTGSSQIYGRFANLDHGRTASLVYAGISYNFVANYFGGDGNDLVLQWAGTKLMAWGVDSQGQLGNGMTTTHLAPVAVGLNGAVVTKIVAGAEFSLALYANGRLASWGRNDAGQLGNGTTTDLSTPTEIPLKETVLDGKTITAIAAGEDFSLVLCSDGSLATWGKNDYGQLGNGSTVDSKVPGAVSVAGTALQGKTVAAVSAGCRHCLVLCSDGTVVTWGGNAIGQLGNGSLVNSNVPVAVSVAGTALEGRTVTAIAAGGFHCLALCSNGTVVAWGYNGYGQLGNSSTTTSPVAVAVSVAAAPLKGKTVTSIVAGQNHSMALCSDGTLGGWGRGADGQLGTTPANTSTPITVSGRGKLAGRTVVKVFAGWTNGGALCSDGVVVMWGGNFFGELGWNMVSGAAIPVETTIAGTPLAGKTVTALSIAFHHCLALCSDGSLAAWGDDRHGQLGTGEVTLFAAPVDISASGVLAGKTALSVAAGGAHSLALCTDGTVAAWGSNSSGQLGNGTSTGQSGLPVLVSTSGVLAGKTVIGVGAGGSHSFAWCSDGTLAAWGNNWYGQLGNAKTKSSSTSPVSISLNGHRVVAVTGGYSHSIALTDTGSVLAWGAGSQGQIGNGTGTDKAFPTSIYISGEPVAMVAAGGNHNLVLTKKGTLWSWGANTYGELGNNSTAQSNVPVSVLIAGTPLAGKTIVAVAAGDSRSLALCSDGTLAAWGRYPSGDGIVASIRVPVLVSASGVLGGRTVQAITSGYLHDVALCADGTAAAWGFGGDGELGSGSRSNFLSPPVTVSTGAMTGGDRILKIISSSGSSHTLAMVAAPAPATPVVSGLTASALTATSVTLSGTVNAKGRSTAVSVEYGDFYWYDTGHLDAFYRLNMPGLSVTGSTAVPVNMTLTGLTPATIYNVRLKGVSSAGTSTGDNLSFRTYGNDASLSGLSLSAGTLSPAFASNVFVYAVTVAPQTSFLSLTAKNRVGNAAKAEVQLNNGPFVPMNWQVSSGGLALNSRGATVMKIRVTAEDGTTHQTYMVSVTHIPSFKYWQDTFFGQATNKTGMMADFDGDGLSNFVEFAFGTDPTVATPHTSPLSYDGDVITPGGITSEMIAGKPTAEFIRRSDYLVAGLIYKVEFSSKLSNWETYAGTPVVLGTDGFLEVVGIPYPKLSDGSHAKFFRVTVSAAP